MLAFNTLESGSYYDPWLHTQRWDTGHSYPLYDGVGHVRSLADGSSVVTDWYYYDAFGAVMTTSGSTKNFRRFGGAWGYMTDPSGLLQLGHRFYRPELGRFVQQDRSGSGVGVRRPARRTGRLFSVVRAPVGRAETSRLRKGGAALGYYVGGALGALLLLWYTVAMAWASSVARHQPELRESAQQVRYGWRCPRCGRTYSPSCKVDKCGGPLVWVQRGTRIKCARCHRCFIAHPMLFRQTPRARRMWCRQCNWVGVVKDWKIG